MINVSVEVSYYPLVDEFCEPIDIFIRKIRENKKITLDVGIMSSVITGEFSEIMELLKNTMEELMILFPSIFSFKISNTCTI